VHEEDEGPSDEKEGIMRHDEEERSQTNTVFSNENSSNSSTNIDAGQRTNEMHNCSRTRTPVEELAHQIATKLASRAYHLPGYDWKQDWIQYIVNNHLLLGICCHHPLHPLNLGTRMLLLLGSFSYGVAVTNAISLLFLITGTTDEEEVFTVNLVVKLPGQQSNPQAFPVTMGILLLLTVGSGSHALFDHFLWNLNACGCCRSVRKGYYVLIFLVIAVVVAFSSCILVMSASMGGWPSCGQCDGLDFKEIFNNQDYFFLTAYVLEFAISSLIYCPVLETVIFSGILGCCGRIPIIGGRPYEMRKESKMQPDEKSECQSQNEESECPSQDEQSECPSQMA